MEIDAELITKLENLSKIELSEEERKTAEKDLRKILNFMDSLSQLDTDGTEPVSLCVSGIDDLRKDVVTESGNPEAILENAKEKRDNCFVVPKTVE